MNFSGRRFVSVNFVAEMFSLNHSTIRRKIDRGEIVACRIGKTLRIDLKRLEEQLENQNKP